MVRTVPFKCPQCGAIYQVIKTEAGPETIAVRLHAALAAHHFLAAKGP